MDASKSALAAEGKRMNRHITLAAGLILLSSPGFIVAQTPPKFPSKVKAVTAKLFYSTTGMFSEDILAKPDIALWNTIIGEGESGGPSDATLITVEIDGDGGPSTVHNEVLSITTQMQGKPLVKRTVHHMLFEQSGKHYEGVWLYGTGCLPIQITVQLDNQKPISKKIDFQCGE